LKLVVVVCAVVCEIGVVVAARGARRVSENVKTSKRHFLDGQNRPSLFEFRGIPVSE
jgi:hypothetical protein